MEFMIAIRPAPKNLQREVDLGAGQLGNRSASAVDGLGSLVISRLRRAARGGGVGRFDRTTLRQTILQLGFKARQITTFRMVVLGMLPLKPRLQLCGPPSNKHHPDVRR